MRDLTGSSAAHAQFRSFPVSVCVCVCVCVCADMEQHDCSYDIKSLHRKSLRAALPEVKADKVSRIPPPPPAPPAIPAPETDDDAPVS